MIKKILWQWSHSIPTVGSYSASVSDIALAALTCVDNGTKHAGLLRVYGMEKWIKPWTARIDAVQWVSLCS